MSSESVILDIYDTIYNNNIDHGKRLIDSNYKSLSYKQKNALIKIAAINGNKDILIHILNKKESSKLKGNLSLEGIIINLSRDNRLRSYEKKKYMDIIKIFLDEGVEVVNEDIEEAIYSGDIELILLLLKNYDGGVDVNLMSKAIKNRDIELVKVLMDSENYNLSDEEEEIVFNYALENDIKIVEMFIKKGIEIPEDALLYATHGGLKVIKLLIDNGVDPKNFEALQEAAYGAYNINKESEKVIDFLLKNGQFDISDIMNLLYDLEEDDEQDYTDIISHIKKSIRIPNLRQQIKESYKHQEFKWQDICSKLESGEFEKKIDRKDLIFMGTELGIKSLDKKSKRELCKIISEEMYDIIESCEDSNLLGDDLNKLPKWRIFKIKGKCYDIIDLKKILRSGETRNPFTREILPVDKINERIYSLEKMSIKGIIETEDLFTRVRDTPIFSKKEYLNQQVVKLFGMFPYMLDTSLIIKATDSEINFMSGKLFKNSANDILQATRNEIEKIEKMKGVEKKIAFVEVLLKTGVSEEKIVLLYDGFLYFSKRVSGEDLSDDRFLYMIGG
jgi:hypothetical protein